MRKYKIKRKGGGAKFFLQVLFIHYQVSLGCLSTLVVPGLYSYLLVAQGLWLSGSLDLVVLCSSVYSVCLSGCHQLVPMLPFGSICLVLVPWFSWLVKWWIVFVLSYLSFVYILYQHVVGRAVFRRRGLNYCTSTVVSVANP